MADVVVTIPKRLWPGWLAEGCLPGERCPRDVRYFIRTNGRPRIDPGERVYIVAHGRLRGYAPLYMVFPEIPALDGDGREGDIIDRWRDLHRDGRHFYLARRGGAVAVTIERPIAGFQGLRYRWWDRAEEQSFPGWQAEGVS